MALYWKRGLLLASPALAIALVLAQLPVEPLNGWQPGPWWQVAAGGLVLTLAVLALATIWVQADRLRMLGVALRRAAAGEGAVRVASAGPGSYAKAAEAFNRLAETLEAERHGAGEARIEAGLARDAVEEAMAALIEALPQGAAIVGAGGRVRHVNSRFRALYRLSADQAVPGMQVADIAWHLSGLIRNPDLRPGEAPRQIRRETIQADRLRRLADAARHPGWEVELSDGRILQCLQQVLADGAVLLLDRDVTEHHRAAARVQALEQELLQKHQLESLGRLAGGIAHEINTPAQYVGDNVTFLTDGLQALIGCLDRVSVELDLRGGGADLREALTGGDIAYLREEMPVALAQAGEGVERIRDIASAVRVYAHAGLDELRPLDVNRIAHQAAVLTASDWKSIALLEEDFAPDLPRVQGSDGRLGQVMTNLLINAVEAMRDWARAEAEPGWVGRIRVSTRLAGADQIAIEVHDSGPGVPDCRRATIFQPFFTTKSSGDSSGRGLALCRAIVTETHGGRIEVGSSPLGGALFRILLPVAPGLDGMPAEDPARAGGTTHLAAKTPGRG